MQCGLGCFYRDNVLTLQNVLCSLSKGGRYLDRNKTLGIFLNDHILVMKLLEKSLRGIINGGFNKSICKLVYIVHIMIFLI